MTGVLTFRFEELPLVDEGGFEAGFVDGEAEISFYPEGEWFIRSISVEALDFKSAVIPKPTRMVEIDRNTELYLNIFDNLERGRFRDAIESDVQTALASAAEDEAAGRGDAGHKRHKAEAM